MRSVSKQEVERLHQVFYITYRALPFPLPESCQRTLKMLSANVQALGDINAYVESLRASIGFDHTRPAIRPHQ